MDQNSKNYMLKISNEPTDKYGAHFEYEDLFQRLLTVKQQRKENHLASKSFDKQPTRPPVLIRLKQNPKTANRSQSITKNPHRALSSDLMKITKIYSPSLHKKVKSPLRILDTIHLNKSYVLTNPLKKRIKRSKVYANP